MFCCTLLSPPLFAFHSSFLMSNERYSAKSWTCEPWSMIMFNCLCWKYVTWVGLFPQSMTETANKRAPLFTTHQSETSRVSPPGPGTVSMSDDAWRQESLVMCRLPAPVRPPHSGRFHLGDFLGIIRKEFVVSWIISFHWKLWTC